MTDKANTPKTTPDKSGPDDTGPDVLHLDDEKPIGLKRIYRVSVMKRSDSRKRKRSKPVPGIGSMYPKL